MKKLKMTVGILVMTLTLTAISCKDGKKDEPAAPMSNEMYQESMDDKDDMAMSDNQDAKAEAILKDYFNLKDALVGDDNDKAKELGATLASTFGNIMEDATEHAEHISESDIAHQREHFKIISKDVTDMVAITGTENTLYQLFCPMYDGGSNWLSMSKDVKNPYYGSKMLTCGEMQKEIN